jgi:hypothetical protein
MLGYLSEIGETVKSGLSAIGSGPQAGGGRAPPPAGEHGGPSFVMVSKGNRKGMGTFKIPTSLQKAKIGHYTGRSSNVDRTAMGTFLTNWTCVDLAAAIVCSRKQLATHRSLVLRFANTVTYFVKLDWKNCSLHSARAHGRGQH